MSRTLRCIAVLMMSLSIPAYAGIPQSRKQELLELLHEDCGACHGSLLKGGLGPPLLPERLSSYTTEFIAQTILQGRPGTPMPPWRPFFTDQEAMWLAKQLKKGTKP